MSDGNKIREFVLRIMSGEKMTSLEDLQFYLNWKTTIEELLFIYSDKKSPFEDTDEDEKI